MKTDIVGSGDHLNPFAQFVPSYQLKRGSVYFCIHYCDDEMLIPSMIPLVFIGHNLVQGEVGQAYFQDLDSYKTGARWDNPSNRHEAAFECFPEGKHGEVGAIYEFEFAVEELRRCALRRRTATSIAFVDNSGGLD